MPKWYFFVLIRCEWDLPILFRLFSVYEMLNLTGYHAKIALTLSKNNDWIPQGNDYIPNIA